MQPLLLLFFVILSKAGNWARYFSLPLLCVALYCFLDFMTHQIIRHCKPWKTMHFFFSRYKKRKNLFLSIFLLILVNINSTSLNGQHFCLPCVFSAVLEFFLFLPLVLEVSNSVISEILCMVHFSNLLRKVLSTCAPLIRRRYFEVEYSCST